MNKLFIIGNGFDLAHGLKTKYSDFILWYLKEVLKELSIRQDYCDDLMRVSYAGNGPSTFKINSVAEFIDLASKQILQVDYKHPFFHEIIVKHLNTNWVDIENCYFKALVKIYNLIERNLVSHPDYNLDGEVKKLNDCLDNIKKQLIKYLLTIEETNKNINERISEHFSREINRTVAENHNILKNKIMFLIFNYTSTINLYNNLFPPGMYEIKYIHGKLNDGSNPIIFGYGDESDIYYEKIERLNSNEFLRNIKSFSYFKTRNYQDLSGFINTFDNMYDVYIMGHSCGISDRVLLKSIFEHPKCREIKIFYHQKDNNESDFFEKTQEISRHFRADLKDSMRNKILSFPACESLT
jgi:hypothetical protein